MWFLDAKTKMNPHLNFGQAIPGRTKGRGIGIIDTAKLAGLVDSISLLPLLLQAAVVYEDERYRALVGKLPRQQALAHRSRLLCQ